MSRTMSLKLYKVRLDDGDEHYVIARTLLSCIEAVKAAMRADDPTAPEEEINSDAILAIELVSSDVITRLQ